jgi:hypothetical protein
MAKKFPSPRGVVNCFNTDGSFDILAFLQFTKWRRRQRRARTRRQLALECLLDESDDEEASSLPKNRPRAQRTCQKRVSVTMFDNLGNVVPLDPKCSTWYITYCSHPKLSCRHFQHLFRRRFRLPHKEFLELVEQCKESNLLEQWSSQNDACGRLTSPLQLMVLGALRYLGRGWTFDDLHEATGIDAETHRQFFHKFIEFGSTLLYNKHVIIPSSEEARSPEYEQAGLPGCAGSMDASHVILEKVPHDLKQLHLGFKHSQTARTYNIVVNHRRRILSSTRGHPARWNDKTLVLFDDFATALRNRTVLDDVEFVLFEKNADGEVVERKYRGAWLIVDNGYLAWSCTIPPIKSTSSEGEIRFSQWLESVRKDVECTFGILKGRFRVLKSGIRLHGIEAADKIWLTCCALHNWLLEVDGWNQPWEGSLGQFEEDDNVPAAINRLNSPAQARSYDTSGDGRGNDYIVGEAVEQPEEQVGVPIEQSEDEQGVRHIRKMSMKTFRSKLIEHFIILKDRGNLRWPKAKKRT